MRPLLLSALLLGACAKQAAPQPVQPDRTLTVLGLNDVYRLDGLPELNLGGLDRLRALRRQLEDETKGPVLVLHAGDALFPSLISNEFKGAQMIDVLNRIDGDAEAFDPHFVLTPGNHEFDKGRCKYAPLLADRIAESQFAWVSSNIEWGPKPGSDCEPAVQPRVPQQLLVDVGGVMVGLLGISTNAKHPDYITSFGDGLAVTRAQTASLRAAGAELVIALTHQSVSNDLALMQAMSGEHGPDLYMGGHDHSRQLESVGDTLLVKADADLITASVVTLALAQDGSVRSTAKHVEMGAEVPRDPDLSQVIAGWSERHAGVYCTRMQLEPNCLDDVIGRTTTDLVAEEVAIRTVETSMGDWAADLALQAHRGDGAHIAVINSGSLRLNRNLPAGTSIRRIHLEEILPYPSDLVVLDVSGATVRAMLHRSIEDWTGNGHWLQVAGLRFVHDPDAGEVRGVELPDGTGGWRALDDTETLRVVVGNYMANPAIGDQDGYTMIGPDDVVALDKSHALKELMRQALEAAGDSGISPATDGRICNTRLSDCTP